MTDSAGFGFTYNPGSTSDGTAQPQEPRPMKLFAWQICLAHLEDGLLEDADNYADYAINRDRICQALGFGMANGQNAFPLGDAMFVVAVSIQKEGEIVLIESSHPRYNDIAVLIAEQLLRGEDHGMVAELPNGNLVPFIPSTDPTDL